MATKWVPTVGDFLCPGKIVLKADELGITISRGRRGLATTGDKEITQIRAWLFTIAGRHLKDFYKMKSRRERWRRTVRLESAVDEPDNYITPYEEAVSSIGCEMIWQQLDCLSETEKKVLLTHIEGYSITEKAEMLGKTTGATRMVLHRARKELKELLEMRGYEV